MARRLFGETMPFTYHGGANPAIDYVRLLIADTDPSKPIFQDSEITSAQAINSAVFSSGQFYTAPMGANLPASPSNYLRAAVLLLRAIACSKARLAAVQSLLDVKLDASKAAAALEKQAAAYETMDDNSGAFFIAEQVNTVWSFRDRFWNQIQRQAGGSLF